MKKIILITVAFISIYSTSYAQQISIYNDTSGDLLFDLSGSELMRLTNGGFLGIGESNPNARLEIFENTNAVFTTGLKTDVSGGTSTSIGISGKATGSSGTSSIGLQGNATGVTGGTTSYAIRGDVTGAANSNFGIYTTSSGASSSNYGTYTTSSGAATSNFGIYATSSDASSFNYGGRFSSQGSSGVFNYGVYGEALTAGASVNYGGRFSASGASINYGIYAETSVTASSNIAGYFSASNATNNYAIVVPSGEGYVGIGTTSPASLFSVGSSSGFQVDNSGNIIKLNGVTASFPTSNASGVLTNDGAGTLTWASVSQSSDWKTSGNSGTIPGTQFLGTSDSQDLAIKTNGTDRVRIKADGNVGIGTTNPSTLFEISKNQDANTALFNISNLTSGTNARAMQTLTADGGSLYITTNSSSYNLISGWANKGVIGTQNILNGLVLFTGGAGDPIEFQLGGTGTTDIIFDGTGNVGIGTTTPEASLHVNGSMVVATRILSPSDGLLPNDYILIRTSSGGGVYNLNLNTTTPKDGRVIIIRNDHGTLDIDLTQSYKTKNLGGSDNKVQSRRTVNLFYSSVLGGWVEF